MEKSCKTCANSIECVDGVGGIECNADGGRGCAGECLHGFLGNPIMFNRWMPREEEKVEKLYTRLEMAQKLFDNPQLKAIDEDGNEVFIREDTNSVKRIMYIKKYATLTLMHIDGEHWRIIEPEPKKVSFAEAFKARVRGKVIFSVISSEKYGGIGNYGIKNASDEEIDGEWIILD
jgi:hypothetical protein